MNWYFIFPSKYAQHEINSTNYVSLNEKYIIKIYMYVYYNLNLYFYRDIMFYKYVNISYLL